MRNLFILLFLIPLSVSAQFSTGTIAIGGNASFTSISESYGNTDYPDSNYLTISPTVGIFIAPTLSLGVFGQISNQNIPTINVVTNLFETQKTTSQIYGVFARKYFSLSDKFLLSLNGRVGLGSREKNDNSDDKTDQFLVSISPSLIFFPHKNWGLEGGFGQISYEKNYQQNYYSDSDRFSASLGGLGLGVTYYINRKE